jgi:hypothetical protein
MPTWGIAIVVLALIAAPATVTGSWYSEIVPTGSGSFGVGLGLSIEADDRLIAAAHAVASGEPILKVFERECPWGLVDLPEDSLETCDLVENPVGDDLIWAAIHVTNWFYKKEGGTWHRKALPSSYNNACMALDQSGGVHFVTNNSAGDIFYGDYVDPGWSTTLVGHGFAPRLEIDPSGNPHILYQASNHGQLYYMKRTGAVWSTPELVNAGAADWGWREVVFRLSGAGVPHVLFTTAGGVRFVRREADSWHSEVLNGNSNGWLDLERDRSGNPTALFAGATSGTIQQAFFSGLTLSQRDLGITAENAEYELAFDSGNQTHVLVRSQGTTSHHWEEENPYAPELTWTRLATASPLVMPQGHTSIQDPTRATMLVFGGWDPFPNETMYLQMTVNANWTTLSVTNPKPPGRGESAAVYDRTHDRMLIFGGYNGSFLNDVWALDLAGSSWSQLTPSGSPPSPRYAHTAIYDAAGDRMIVFGGYDGVDVLNDVWELSLSGPPVWTQLSPAGAPPAPRSSHTSIYDALHDRMIVFGGNDNQVWSLSLQGDPEWTQLCASGTIPATRYAHTAVYDPDGDAMVIFGGEIVGTGARTDESWAFSLTARRWTQLQTPSGAPMARYTHVAEYDLLQKRMIIQGGSAPTGAGGDTWSLQLHPFDTSGIPESPETHNRAIVLCSPNPMSRAASVTFETATSQQLAVDVFDPAGRPVATLASRQLFHPGSHSLRWDGRDSAGRSVPAGTYFVRVSGETILARTKLTVLGQ